MVPEQDEEMEAEESESHPPSAVVKTDREQVDKREKADLISAKAETIAYRTGRRFQDAQRVQLKDVQVEDSEAEREQASSHSSPPKPQTPTHKTPPAKTSLQVFFVILYNCFSAEGRVSPR